MKKGFFALFFLFVSTCFVLSNVKTVWQAEVNINPKVMVVSQNAIYLLNEKGVEAYSKDGKLSGMFKSKSEGINLNPVLDNNGNLWFSITKNLGLKNTLVVLSEKGKVLKNSVIKNVKLLGNSLDGKTIYIAKGGKWGSIYGGNVLINQRVVALNAEGFLNKRETLWEFYRENVSLYWAYGLKNGKTLLNIEPGKLNPMKQNQSEVFLLNKKGNYIKSIKLKDAKKPVLGDSLVFFINLDPKTYGYRISAFDTDTLEKKWDYNIPSGTAKTHPTYVNGKIYFTIPYGGNYQFRGTIYVLSAKTGKVLKTLYKGIDLRNSDVREELFMTDGLAYKNKFFFQTFHLIFCTYENGQTNILFSKDRLGRGAIIKTDGEYLYLFHIINGKKVLEKVEMNGKN